VITSYRDDNEDGNNVWYWKRRSKQENEYSKKVKKFLVGLNLPKLPFAD
jgi:hypothetical protein